MPTQTLLFQLLSAAIAVALPGCAGVHNEPVTPGPVPLRGASGSARANAHMRSFLVGSWRAVGKPYELRATFAEDRRFTLKISGADLATPFPGAFPEAGRLAEGTWSATSEVLTLEAHRTGGRTDLALGWLDGKLNIQIGDIQLRRR